MSTTEHVVRFRQILLKQKWQYSEAVHQLFIDIKKTYDSVRREVLYNILIEFGIPMKLVMLVKMCLNETCSGVWVSKHLSDIFPIKNGLKPGDALSPLLFNFTLENAIRRVQVIQDGLKLNGLHQLLVYADDVSVLGGSVYTIKENAETLVVAGKEMGLEVNAGKTKYMFMSRDQNSGRSHSIWIDDNSFEMMEELKYLGTTLTFQNFIQEDIKSRLNSGNACYHSVQNHLSSSFLCKNLKNKVYKNIILPVVLYECKTWSLTLRDERRLRVLGNRVLRRIFGHKRDVVAGEWRKVCVGELNCLYSSSIIVRTIKSRRMRLAGHVARMREKRLLQGSGGET